MQKNMIFFFVILNLICYIHEFSTKRNTPNDDELDTKASIYKYYRLTCLYSVHSFFCSAIHLTAYRTVRTHTHKHKRTNTNPNINIIQRIIKRIR